ncbi:MAG: hypothetical protein U0792_04015 [Gemmataceae bacterium]
MGSTTGKVNGKDVGIAVFEGPSNTPKASWHVRAYGLNAANSVRSRGQRLPVAEGEHDVAEARQGRRTEAEVRGLCPQRRRENGQGHRAFEVFKK